MKTLYSLVAVGCTFVPAVAQHTHAHGAHYTREPEAISGAGSFSEYVVASDEELTVVVFRSEPDEVTRATTSDGRSLGSTFSASQAISSTTATTRHLEDSSVHVVGDEAVVIWREDTGSGAFRAVAAHYVGGAWGAPVVIGGGALSPVDVVTSFAAVMKPGVNGSPTAAVMLNVMGANGPRLLLSVSSNGGAGFSAPIAVSQDGMIPGATATQIGGVAVDLQLGQLHMSWSDDRDGTMSVYYRRAVLSFFGQPIFTPPHGTGDVAISSGDEVVGAPQLQVNGELRWSGTNQKYVGIAWLENTSANGNETLVTRSSHDFGDSFNPESVVAHTGRADVNVSEFDFEIVGDTFVVTWQDNAEDDALGVISVPVPAETHVWHAESDDGTTFDPAFGAIVARMSAQEDPDHIGSAPCIAKSAGTPSGSMIAFLERTDDGHEIYTAFADQEFGGAWHLDDYPVVSEAQFEGGPGTIVREPQIAYNARYNNFVIVWAQETVSGSGSFEVVVSGYRPQQVEVDGWHLGSPGLQFELEHLAFEDSFAFVLVALNGDDAMGGNFLIPDTRKTGLIADSLTITALDPLFYWFSAPNDPIQEGATTPLLPLPPLPLGIELHYVGVTWSPVGGFHLLTDRAVEEYGPAGS